MHDFNGIIGNENIVDNLKSSIINNRINHAYIIEGQEGAGKTLLAKTFAKALQCEALAGGGYSCGECTSCLSFESGNNPDIIYVAPAKTKALGVDDIRQQVNNEMALRPYKFRYKIFIIEDADNMTVAAQNALLKTLEEPYNYGVFLITVTNINSLLPTVLSRCFLIKLNSINSKDVELFLMSKLKLSPEKAHFISAYASGSIGKAIKTAEDKKFSQMREMIISVLDKIDQKDLADVFMLYKEFEKMKDDIAGILDICILWYRDIAVLKEFNDMDFVLQKDIQDSLIENTYLSFESIYDKIETLWDIKNCFRYNVNFQLATETLLMKLNS